MNAKRVLAIIGIILLLALYASTLVFALMDSPNAQGLLMGAIFCTIAVPVILHFTIRAAESYSRRQKDALEEHEAERRRLMEEAEDEDVPEDGTSADPEK